MIYMVGKESTLSALGVARLLTDALPRVQVVEFEGLGHMRPVTHPRQDNKAIADYFGGQYLAHLR